MLQITVSSGGMLTQKLDIKDLQFEKMQPFDGTMAYAQNKRQQVVMTEEYARRYPKVHFSSMHPGWADTPGKLNKDSQFLEGAHRLWVFVSKAKFLNLHLTGIRFYTLFGTQKYM